MTQRAAADDELPEFPAGFLWGAATAAYQVEGARREGGSGRSTWDVFCERAGAVRDGSTGAVAADHVHRLGEDVQLVRRLGLGAYRLSLSWPRIQPDGTGPVNPAGLALYDEAVDALLLAGVDPCVTLHHWDLPQALEDAGGWLARDTAYRFAEYAEVCVQALSDRVTWWTPVHEPNVLAVSGYVRGVHAPGRTLGAAALPVAQHLLLGHGLAVQALRAGGARSVGGSVRHGPALHAPTEGDPWGSRLFSGPLLAGRFPAGVAERLTGPVEQDLEVASTRLDFYDVSVDLAAWTAGDPAGSRAGLGDGLTATLMSLRDGYGDQLPRLHVSAVGDADDLGPDRYGRVADQHRIDRYDETLRAVRRAMHAGVDVAGFFVEPFLDGFEWDDGYTCRRGLVHVDFENQFRTPKDAFHWYANVIDRSSPWAAAVP